MSGNSQTPKPANLKHDGNKHLARYSTDDEGLPAYVSEYTCIKLPFAVDLQLDWLYAQFPQEQIVFRGDSGSRIRAPDRPT
jgi:hypothetical protein